MVNHIEILSPDSITLNRSKPQIVTDKKTVTPRLAYPYSSSYRCETVTNHALLDDLDDIEIDLSSSGSFFFDPGIHSLAGGIETGYEELPIINACNIFDDLRRRIPQYIPKEID